MTFSDDCPCGRSQDLTFAESSGKFSVDRQTFERLILLVEWCAKELVIYRYRDCNTFLASLNTYLSSDSAETSDSLEVRKASLLLNYYHDIIPEALDELQKRLKEAGVILDSWTTVSESFWGRYGND
jgi:hypothetical protein